MSDNFFNRTIWRRPPEAFLPCDWDVLPNNRSDYDPLPFGYHGTPLEADRLSRLIVGEYSSCTGPAREIFLSGSPGPYRATVEVPEGCYTVQELDEIRTTISRLNAFTKVPVTEFAWSPESSYYASYYDTQSHTVALGHRPLTAPHIPRIDGTKTELIHEMGHAIYQKGFLNDRAWEAIYSHGMRSENFENFEIIDDSNYLRGSQDGLGHPVDSAHEAFASSVHAYFLHADQFTAYIQNERTPEDMRSFGKQVWIYMRDEVFGGAVFTSKGLDPFAGEQLENPVFMMPLPHTM